MTGLRKELQKSRLTDTSSGLVVTVTHSLLLEVIGFLPPLGLHFVELFLKFIRLTSPDVFDDDRRDFRHRRLEPLQLIANLQHARIVVRLGLLVVIL